MTRKRLQKVLKFIWFYDNILYTYNKILLTVNFYIKRGYNMEESKKKNVKLIVIIVIILLIVIAGTIYIRKKANTNNDNNNLIGDSGISTKNDEVKIVKSETKTIKYTDFDKSIFL